MGATQSTPAQAIYNAAEKGNTQELQRLVTAIQRRNPDYDPACLSFRDKAGRTPLIICARMNRPNCAKVLLMAGANVHYINITQDSRGGALHEAAHRGSDAMVELLLQYGASPWVANVYGRTPMDEAVMSESVTVMHRFRQRALFHGTVCQVKARVLLGLMDTFKPRHAMVCPYYLCPKDGVINQQTARKQLWFFADDKTAAPKVRLWLDGATVARFPTHALLRLHRTHPNPNADLATTIDAGCFCVHLRPLDNMGLSTNSFNHLLEHCGPVTTIAPSGLPAPPPAARAPHGAPAPLRSSIRAPALAPTPAPQCGLVPGRCASDSLSESLHALPGESDADFAARLGAVFGAAPCARSSSAQPLSTPPRPSAAPPAASPPPRPATAAPPAAAGGAAAAAPGAGGAAAAAAGTAAGAGGGAAAPAGGGAAEAPAAGEQDHGSPCAAALLTALMQSTSEEGGASAPASFMGLAAEPETPSAPAADLLEDDDSLLPPPRSASASPRLEVRQQQLQVHLAQQAQQQQAQAQAAPEDDPERCCTICLSAPRECGLLHGGTMHLCLCRDCKKGFPPGSACPLCRMQVERIIDVF